MKDRFDEYDWEQAFGYSTHFSRDDIDEVIAMEDGMNDELDWLGVFKLKDGRFGYLSAWCDYTGWDCQSGGHSKVAATLERLMRDHVPQKDAERLGLNLRGEKVEPTAKGET